MADIYSMVRGGYRAAKGQVKSDQDKAISDIEFRELLKTTKLDRSKHGADAYDLFFLCGNFCLRQSEALELEASNFKSIAMGYFRVRTLKVEANGSKHDRAYVGRSGIKPVQRLLDRRHRYEGLLFPFTSRTARYLFAYYADRAGISPNVSFHSLRHRAAKAIFKANGNNHRIADEFLRHKPKTTTDLYLIPTAQEMMDAVDAMGIVE